MDTFEYLFEILGDLHLVPFKKIIILIGSNRQSMMNLLLYKYYVDAENAFKKAVELDNKQRWYWNGLYDVYYQTKDYQKSIPIVEKLIEFDGNMREDLVSLYMNTNQHGKALELLKDKKRLCLK